MDNIAIEVSALSCLLPLLALIILTVQFCRLSAFKSGIPLVYTIEDKFSSSYEGLISINNQSKLQIDQDSCSTFNPNSTYKVCNSSKKHSEFSQDRLGREANLCFSTHFLSSCKIGLSKMNRINKAYFQKNRETLAMHSSKKMKARKNNKTQASFEPTKLSVIVEGLQY